MDRLNGGGDGTAPSSSPPFRPSSLLRRKSHQRHDAVANRSPSPATPPGFSPALTPSPRLRRHPYSPRLQLGSVTIVQLTTRRLYPGGIHLDSCTRHELRQYTYAPTQRRPNATSASLPRLRRASHSLQDGSSMNPYASISISISGRARPLTTTPVPHGHRPPQ
jgi:hypothetical protein